MSAALAVAVVAVAWAWRSTLGGIHRDTEVVAELSPSHRDDPVNILVVGNDSRERIKRDAGTRFGAVDTTTGQRADLVMLVRFSPKENHLRALSLPRDLQLDVDGFGPQKLASTLDLGGSRLLVRTARELTGLPIHHYIELDFVGFARLVDRAGGVWMDFPEPARDESSGLEVEAGANHLDGDAALALVRSRDFETLEAGAWVTADDGDAGRIERQHRFLLALATRVRSGAVSTRIRQLTDLGGHVTVDARLSTIDILRLAHRASAARLDDGDLRTLPTESVRSYEDRISPFPPLHIGGIGYESLRQPEAAAAIAAFASSKACEPCGA